MSAVTSSVRNIGNDGIPDPGLPVARRRTRSASETTVGNCPRRKSSFGIWSPFAAVTHHTLAVEDASGAVCARSY
jgi:hypothetical protein